MSGARPVLVVLGGVRPSSTVIRSLARDAQQIICADGAAEAARIAGILPHLIVGDLDSITQETREFFEHRQIPIHHNPDQYSNDFEKALRFVASPLESDVFVVGMSGGRLDHTLTNLSVMLRLLDCFRSIVAIDDGFEQHILTKRNPEIVLSGAVDSLVSLSGLGSAEGVTTEHLLYPLTDATVAVGMQEGLSNRIVATPASVRIRSGALLVSVERPL